LFTGFAFAPKDREAAIRLPKTDKHYIVTSKYIEDVPDADYVHASETAYENFKDMKFSVRICWGVYAGSIEKGKKYKSDAGWSLLGLSNQERQSYQEQYKTFNPTEFDAEKWMQLFQRAGAQGFAFITKHHDGFALFHTNTRVKSRMNYAATPPALEECDIAYSIQDTPFKRDIVKELCDAGHKYKMKIDLYFSHPDWYDADFRPYCYHPLATSEYQKAKNKSDWGQGTGAHADNGKKIELPNLTQAEKERLIRRHREQLHELLTNYGKVDMVCLDMWLGKDVWQETKETVKLMRQWQPDVMIRARGIGNYGDYYTPEGFVPGAKENTDMPWMTIYPLGRGFEYEPEAGRYKGTQWIVWNIIDAASKDGSFMAALGPDEKGNFHPEAVKQLEAAGKWLKVNGEGIYLTRARNVWKEGDDKNPIRFTRSKDGKKEFAFVKKLPKDELVLKSIKPKAGSAVKMFGVDTPLKWETLPDGGIKIAIPGDVGGEYAWGFEITQ
jgi:alpha-L-fucosidase